jgi:hypothetical protein
MFLDILLFCHDYAEILAAIHFILLEYVPASYEDQPAEVLSLIWQTFFVNGEFPPTVWRFSGCDIMP